MKVEQNILRLKHLMSLYMMTEEELITLTSKGLKKPLTREQLFAEQIEISHLKRIDKLFNKGLPYYTNPNQPVVTNDASIFFRKTKFDKDLNFGARQIVNQFEELKISLSAIAKLSDVKIERILPIYNVTHDPIKTANEVRTTLNPKFEKKQRDFLKGLINNFADYNILVFEFVETWNKTYKANIDGLFLLPNVIVVKRQQKAFRREIFTLVHELAHYLLNIEEVEEVDFSNLNNQKTSDIEYWCNQFAFAFLASDFKYELKSIQNASKKNDYHINQVAKISEQTHLSKLAIYTHLLNNKQITWNNYSNIKSDLHLVWKKNQEQEEREKRENKIRGVIKRGNTPKPINSPLLISTLQSAFYEGVISEYDFCKTLKISPDKINVFLE